MFDAFFSDKDMSSKALMRVIIVRKPIRPEWRRGALVTPNVAIVFLVLALALTFGVSGYRLILGLMGAGQSYSRHP
ncbi:hypothetical protein [Nitrospirillum sp. BR 11163]|uniref:hypothetical protein n=1 Tax=Nitrospirillum sp. BR 11163 TaxID=3104323 RepID=UPI002AFE2BFE|nr:hypothetical protein [Nitrospirillum sp. BR 11163]MEA1675478.1 hypothetical protein [Nitrospirillum sp. BR 11163]